MALLCSFPLELHSRRIDCPYSTVLCPWGIIAWRIGGYPTQSPLGYDGFQTTQSCEAKSPGSQGSKNGGHQ